MDVPLLPGLFIEDLEVLARLSAPAFIPALVPTNFNRPVAETRKPRWRETGKNAGQPVTTDSRSEMLAIATPSL